MNIQARHKEKGFVTLITLSLLLIMVSLLMINSLTVIRLRREMKELEKQQIRRSASVTNQAPVEPSQSK
jgi:cytoskeletal protein RodZ